MSYSFSVKGLTVGYQKTPLIRDIELYMEPGEILTLIGPNGGGKSTILKSITRQLDTLAGTVYIGEQEIHAVDYKELAKRMAVVLTERVHTEMMRCHDVVALGRYPYTGHLGLLKEEDERIVRESMERVHVEDLMERDFMTISDGQKQRVMLARAICQQPEIIVLDEPTSYLDIRHKVELLTILRSMARENHTTIIMSLHEIDLAQKISDQVLCVKGEVCSHYGTPEEIFRKEIIYDLYEISEDTYNLNFGSIEIPRWESRNGEDNDPERDEQRRDDPTGDNQRRNDPAGDYEQKETDDKRVEETGVDEFVISSAGSGIETYRKLSRMGIPYAAGILYENDIDFQVASALAKHVVTEKAFEPISDRALQEAKLLIDECKRVRICDPVIGSQNDRLQELIDYAREQGKVV